MNAPFHRWLFVGLGTLVLTVSARVTKEAIQDDALRMEGIATCNIVVFRAPAGGTTWVTLEPAAAT